MVAVEVKHLTKTFPGVKALSDVSLKIDAGELHAIVGENGAGKSTLMKILGGVYPGDAGEIFIMGKKTHIGSISDSHKAGISVVYQEFNLMPELSIAENIFSGRMPTLIPGVVNIAKLNEEAQKLIDSLDLNLKATSTVATLSVAQQQMIEIVKALSHNSDIIVMDEPTASLSNKEVDTLYRIIGDLKKQGKTIIYISHRMREIFDLADSVSVLRDGVYVGTKKITELTQESLVDMMVGRSLDRSVNYLKSEPGETVLEVKGLGDGRLFDDVSFTVRAGEIVGVAGLAGCFHEDIMKAIYGLHPITKGEILVNGKKVNVKNPRAAIKEGIAFVTEDRKQAGIFAQMTVRENVSMNILNDILNLFVISEKRENEELNKYTKLMNMKYANYGTRIMSLSGGNQQKFVLARALAADCKVLLLLEPTRGIDVGAKAEIYSLMADLAAEGLAILVLSSELPEIMTICHRTLVVHQGKITGNIPKNEMDEALIMQCATGTTTKFSGGVL
ncbi:MAG: sugar ABC transporter ATP-binding protein [Acutalibacter sp.]|nr:sugar ABC transporter ATP-binding protein [Acutalibacter sp.]